MSASDAGYRLDWISWVIRVLAWDGLLPFLIELVPTGIRELNLGVVAVNLTAVFVLVVALLVRTLAGMAYIRSNCCNDLTKSLQIVVFFIGIIWLMPLDLAMILCPVNQHFETFDDVVLFVLAYTGYVIMMVIAMYPGRSRVFLCEEATD
jgi:hypothetical protein